MNIQILTSEAPAAARRTRVRAFIVRVVGDNLQDDQDHQKRKKDRRPDEISPNSASS